MGKIKLFRRLPVRLRFALMIFAFFCLSAGLVAGLGIYRDVQSIHRDTEREISTILELAGQDFLKLLLLDTAEIAADISARLNTFTQIEQAVLYDRQNHIVYTYAPLQETPPLQPEAMQTIQKIDEHYHIAQPIMHAGLRYGTAYFKLSTGLLRERMQELFGLLQFAVPLLLAGLLFASYLFQRFFTTPIIQLASFINRAAGNGDYSRRIAIQDRSEIGELFNGLNNMFDKIEQTTLSLYQEKDRLHVTLESIGDGVITTDHQGTILYMNPVAEQLTAWNEKDAVGLPLDTVYHVHDELTGKQIRHKVRQCLCGDKTINSDQLILSARSGKKIAIKSSFAPIESAGKPVGCVVVVHDVTESREMARRLSYQATHDALTDLRNRKFFETHLAEILAKHKERPNTEGAVMFIDLDQFKIVNDTCGHTAGDALLKQVANLLGQSTREIDTISRLGGDEFGIILENCPLANAMEIAEKLRNRIGDLSFSWQEKTFKLGVSIGLVPLSGAFANHNEIMSAADVACYAAKDLGRNRIHVYREDDQHFAKRHSEMHWVTRINKALKENRLRLYVQSILPVKNAHHPVYEVLLRLEEDGAIIPPGAFLPAAERYNLMPLIDTWVVDTLFQSAAAKRRIAAQPDTVYHLNLSGTTLNHSNFTERLADKFSQFNMRARNICFEITETSAVSNLAEAARFIETCKKLGCQFALDDFGSGVSSFNYLKNLRVDYLKIDGCFVRDMLNDPVDDTMVEAINHVGHILGIRTVAEFVENKATFDRLKHIGVDFAQGYYLHEPAPLVDSDHASSVARLVWSAHK